MVDDGSTDNSAAICKKFCEKHPNARYYYKKNGGVSSARNLGISKACGKWITFVDSDDAVRPEHLDIIQLEKDTEADWIIESFCDMNGNNIPDNLANLKPLGSESIESLSPAKYFFTDFQHSGTPMFSVCGKFYKREICNKYGICFKEDRHFGEDYIFNLEYLSRVKKMVHYPKMFTYIQIDRFIQGQGIRLSSKLLSLDEYYDLILDNYKTVRLLDHLAENTNIEYGIKRMVYGIIQLTLINYSRRKTAKKLRPGELLAFTQTKVRPLLQSVIQYKALIKDSHISMIFSLVTQGHCRTALAFCRFYGMCNSTKFHLKRLLSIK